MLELRVHYIHHVHDKIWIKNILLRCNLDTQMTQLRYSNTDVKCNELH